MGCPRPCAGFGPALCAFLIPAGHAGYSYSSPLKTVAASTGVSRGRRRSLLRIALSKLRTKVGLVRQYPVHKVEQCAKHGVLAPRGLVGAEGTTWPPDIRRGGGDRREKPTQGQPPFWESALRGFPPVATTAASRAWGPSSLHGVHVQAVEAAHRLGAGHRLRSGEAVGARGRAVGGAARAAGGGDRGSRH